ncbi:MAG: DUF2953 domain-containing protein [Syntrophomonadaceae bacterium]|nr:DUF2953 domain-containing protein [Syntrophomonadaceae bacterium]
MVEVRIGGEKSWLNIEISLWRKLIKRKFSLDGLGFDHIRDDFFHKLWQVEKDNQKEDSENRPDLSGNEITTGARKGLEFKKKLGQYPWMKKLLRKGVRVRVMRWKTVIGLGDPMSTAIVSGLIWGAKGGILAFLTGLLAIPVMQIQVSPNYAERKYESVLLMELNLRIAYLLLFAVGAYRLVRSIRDSDVAPVPHQQSA